jgi:glutathione S-transferase
MIKIHHLGHSQSERIVWLCEELKLPYDIVRHTRDAVTRLSPPSLKALHPLGAAPLIEEGDLLLAESAAIVEYISVVHGASALKPGPSHANYTDFLYWFHFANGNLQPTFMRLMAVTRTKLPADHPVLLATQGRFDLVLQLVEARLATVPYFAGAELTLADIMSVFTLTTARLFHPFDLAPYPHTLAYLARIGARPAYQRAMAKGDPDLTPMLAQVSAHLVRQRVRRFLEQLRRARRVGFFHRQLLQGFGRLAIGGAQQPTVGSGPVLRHAFAVSQHIRQGERRIGVARLCGLLEQLCCPRLVDGDAGPIAQPACLGKVARRFMGAGMQAGYTRGQRQPSHFDKSTAYTANPLPSSACSSVTLSMPASRARASFPGAE